LSTLPGTFALWESGRIDTAKARAVDDATVVLSDELARAVEARVLARAPGQTLAQLKAALARGVIAADPDGAEARHREARRDRRVVVTAEPDGMGTLWAMLTATDAAGAFTWLTRLARGLGAEDPRSMDARRADILAALLNGRPIQPGLVYAARIVLACAPSDPRRSPLCDRVRSGMAVQAEIKTGRRRIIQYLLSPINQAVSEAGRER